MANSITAKVLITMNCLVLLRHRGMVKLGIAPLFIVLVGIPRCAYYTKP